MAAKDNSGREVRVWAVLAFVQQHDPAALLRTPAERVTRDAAQAYVTVLQARISPMGVAAALNHLVLAVRAMSLGTDWSWLWGIQQKIANKARPRDKRARMVSARQLYELGWQLMRDANEASTAGERFRTYRDGLLIALLCSRPLRRSNIAGLRLGENVSVTSNAVRLHFTGDEMKNDRPHAVWVPGDLVAPLLRYVRDLRANLPQATLHNAVWCSSNGRALTPDAIYHLILRRTQAAFGVGINMHLFRDIAATALAVDAPAEARLARDLLAHAHPDTTQRHYVQAQSQVAGTQYICLTDLIRSSLD